MSLAVHGEKTMKQRTPTGSMRTFFIIWLGQLISMMGSGLTGFALGVWVYQETKSVTDLTLISFFAVLPVIILSPIAGALVDRWDRRWALIISDTGASLTPLSLIFVLAPAHPPIWQIYAVVMIGAIFRAFQFPAFTAATTLLVPKEHLSRASGMTQLAQGLAQILSPALAGVLLALIGIRGILMIDVLSFLFSVGALLLIHIPRPQVSEDGASARGSLLRESLFGLTYIVARPGLLGLLLFFAISNFTVGAVVVLATPLMLSFTTSTVLGTVLSVAGFGILAGGLLMSVWGGPQRRILGVLGGELLSGICIIIAGFAPSALLIGVMSFFFTMGMPITASSSQAIWQRKVATDVQGRVFSIRIMISMAAMPLAYLVCGPLADYVFNPLLLPNGLLADSVGQIIGVGPGRGIGLLFITLGLLIVLAVLGGRLSPRLWNVEDELPDAVIEPAVEEHAADAVGHQAMI